MVVFDCDETLTLSTFMPRERGFDSQIGWSSWPDYISMMNFGTPFIEGSRDFESPTGAAPPDGRLDRLRKMFKELKGEAGSERTLAVLTRNQRGAVACLNLLTMANLAEHFSVIWCMVSTPSKTGVYFDGKQWKQFEAPTTTVKDHKADVLTSVASDPMRWLPQLRQDGGWDGYGHLKDMSPECIVLVDDVRTNFQSQEGDTKILRYCKVARYDGKHPHMGFLSDMGGLGARHLEDYTQLVNFVEQPWTFKAAFSCTCMERHFNGCEAQPPAKLIIFEFDETLSLYTFMPHELEDDPDYATKIGYLGSQQKQQHYREWNFESPYCDDQETPRVEHLKNLFRDLTSTEGEDVRTLAVLTENEAGAVAVLNLLLMADLAEYFSAIWALGAEEGKPKAVYKDGAEWKTFTPSVSFKPQESQKFRLSGKTAKPMLEHSKDDVLACLLERPLEWFPQFGTGDDGRKESLLSMRAESVVFVDDERTNFNTSSSSSERPEVLRYCKVARYDEEYRDQGLLMHMGGLGARSVKDYRTLSTFVDRPWKYRINDPDHPECCPHPDQAEIKELLEKQPVEPEEHCERRARKRADTWTGGGAHGKSPTQGLPPRNAKSMAAAPGENDLGIDCEDDDFRASTFTAGEKTVVPVNTDPS